MTTSTTSATAFDWFCRHVDLTRTLIAMRHTPPCRTLIFRADTPSPPLHPDASIARTCRRFMDTLCALVAVGALREATCVTCGWKWYTTRKGKKVNDTCEGCRGDESEPNA